MTKFAVSDILYSHFGTIVNISGMVFRVFVVPVQYRQLSLRVVFVVNDKFFVWLFKFIKST